MKWLKVGVPAIAVILAITLPLTLLNTDIKQPEQTLYSYLATIPEVPDYGNPASLVWSGIEPVTEVVVEEETGVIVSNESKDVGQLIADFGVFLAEYYGNGTDGATNRFHYDNSSAGVYSTEHGYLDYEMASEHLSQIVTNELDYMNFSCAAFASFCQKKILGDLVYYDLSCGKQGLLHYRSVIAGNDIFWSGGGIDDPAFDYVKEYAKPGDLLVYTSSSNKTLLENMAYSWGGFAHTELYIGSYGDWEYACVGSNMKGRDVSIKPLEKTLYSGHTRIYLISLSDWLAQNNYEAVIDEEISFEELAKEVS